MMFSFALAAPPTQANINFELGLQIETPIFEVLKAGENHLINAHVYNVTSGLKVDNTTTSCEAHLYNASGIHIVVADMVYFTDDNDFETLILGGNFTTGQYSLMVNCDDGTIGGFFEFTFVVNAEGQEYGVAYSVIYSGVLFLLLFLFALLIGAVKLLPQDTANDDGEILQVSQLKHLNIVFYAAAYGVAMAIFFISSNVALAFFSSEMMGNFLFVVFQIMFYGLFIMLPLAVIRIIAKIADDKEIKMMIQRGVPVGKTF